MVFHQIQDNNDMVHQHEFLHGLKFLYVQSPNHIHPSDFPFHIRNIRLRVELYLHDLNILFLLPDFPPLPEPFLLLQDSGLEQKDPPASYLQRAFLYLLLYNNYYTSYFLDFTPVVKVLSISIYITAVYLHINRKCVNI